jgi:hypothetical protein
MPKLTLRSDPFVDLQHALDHCSTWSTNNCLRFSPAKSAFIHFTNKRKPPQARSLQLLDFSLQQQNSYKYLGVWLDANLRWSTQANKIQNR